MAIELLLACLSFAQPHSEQISLLARDPMLVAIVQLSPEPPAVDLVPIVTRILEPRTSLAVHRGVLPACKASERFSCWARSVRPDYDPTHLENVPFDDHLRRLRERGEHPPRYLLVISIQDAGPGVLEHSALLIDTDAALRAYHDAPRSEEHWIDAVEDRIFTGSANGRFVLPASASRTDVERELAALVDETIAPVLALSKHLAPNGALRISATRAPLEVRVDGARIATLSSEGLRATGVPAGRRHVELVDLRGVAKTFAADVDVPLAGTATITALIELIPDAFVERAHDGAIIGGAAAAVIGAVLVSYAAARAGDETYFELCRSGSCSEDGGSTFAAWPGTSPEGTSDERGGLELAPLGVALIAGGATSALGTWLVTAGDELPWLPVVAGIALGAITYVAM